MRSLFLKCSKCEYTKNLVNLTLYNSSKAHWNLLCCALCRKTSTSRSWFCPCVVQWFTCNIHRAHGFNCKTTPQIRSQAEQVAGVAAFNSSPEPAHKKRRLRLGQSSCIFLSSTFEWVQLQPAPTMFADNSGDAASSTTAAPVISF